MKHTEKKAELVRDSEDQPATWRKIDDPDTVVLDQMISWIKDHK